MPELRGFALLAREVTANDALFERYAARVPVLLVDGDEFDWPFDLQRLRGKL